jgi:FG-GAP repeat
MCLAASLSLAGTAAAQPALNLQLVALGFVNPVGLANARDGSNRLFIVEQGGDLNWIIAGTGDFNGDGKSDILWRHSSGAVFMNLMNGPQVTTSASMGGDLNWTPIR